MAKRRKGFLNIRAQLEYAQDLLELYRKYGDCPAFKDEIPKFLLINRAILNKHDRLKAQGNRKDLYLEAPHATHR